jgi:hypothetical protein
MPTYVTYLELSLNPNSAAPTEIVSALKGLGWRPVYGQYDFAWSWDAKWNGNGGHGDGGNPNANEAFWNQINEAHKVLQRLNVTWSFRTYEQGREDFYARWSE